MRHTGRQTDAEIPVLCSVVVESNEHESNCPSLSPHSPSPSPSPSPYGESTSPSPSPQGLSPSPSPSPSPYG